MEEIWKDIEGYDGYYKVSSFGRIWSSGKFADGRIYKAKILVLRCDKFGYFYVNLYKDGHSKTMKVHRLVANAFIPNPENKPCIDHINTNKKDNRVENLRWVTYKENANNVLTRKHLSDAGKINKNNKEIRLKMSAIMKQNIEKVMAKVRVSVLQLTKEGVIVAEHNSTVEAARSVNGNATSICRACRKKRPSAYGYIWEYKTHGRKRN